MSNEDPTGAAAATAAQVAMAGLSVGEAMVRTRRDRRLQEEHRVQTAQRAEERTERASRRVETGAVRAGESAPSAAQMAAEVEAAREGRTGDELWRVARHSDQTPDDPATPRLNEELEGDRLGRAQAAAAGHSQARADSARTAAAQAAQDYPQRPRPQRPPAAAPLRPRNPQTPPAARRSR